MIKDSPWNSFNLNPLLIKCLLENGYTKPTDIQAHSLPYHQYKTDLILASKTGSGKTLCFGIPLLSDLMSELGLTAKYDGSTPISAPKRKNIRALVITPTRELAIQIMRHFEKINKYTKKYIKIGVIVGGLSKEKQIRILNQCPQILIATPGRLWDMLDKEHNPFLQTLKKVNYLFLDEADKMIELGHFKELDKILSFIYQKEVRMKSDFPMIKNAQQTETLEDFYIKGPGGKMVSLNDSSLNILHENEYILQNENDNDFEENGDVETNDEFQEENADEEENPEIEWTEDQENLDEDDFAQEEGEEDNYDENEENYEDEESNLNDQDDAEVPKYRRTIVLSATLASSYDNRKKSKKRKDKGKGKGKKKEKEVTKIKGGETTSFKLETLMKKIQFNGKPKLIDLTQESKIPETLIEYKCLCTDEEKILYIYHFLRENPDKSFIIFANTIPAAKRVFAVLTKLEIPAVCLHSEMQQRQRLKKLEKFSNKQSLVLVCTDVASRGLDIPQVNFVVHYQIPRDCDTYVHRSGRTARIGHEGVAYALVGPSDKPNYNSICKKLRDGEGIQTITLSKNALDKIQEMVEAATELEHGEFLLQKQKKSKEWFAKNAKQAEMMIDEDLEKELEETNEEINKKRKIVTKGQISYNKIKQNTKQQLINPKKSKSVFLDSFQIANMSSMISSYGLQKAGVNDTTKVKGRSSHRKGRRK